MARTMSGVQGMEYICRGTGCPDEKAPAGQINAVGAGKTAVPVHISEISLEEQDRTPTGFGELDRVLGSGIVKGSLVLVGGDPGIGEIDAAFTGLQKPCRGRKTGPLYFRRGIVKADQDAYESHREISGDLLFLCETNLDTIHSAIERAKPDVVIIDSIQTMFREDISSAPGSVSQVRESTNLLMQIAKGYGITIFIVGHVTKEGVIAGPRVLEHMVDTVLYFEGDRNDAYRVLRAVKTVSGPRTRSVCLRWKKRTFEVLKSVGDADLRASEGSVWGGGSLFIGGNATDPPGGPGARDSDEFREWQDGRRTASITTGSTFYSRSWKSDAGMR